MGRAAVQRGRKHRQRCWDGISGSRRSRPVMPRPEQRAGRRPATGEARLEQRPAKGGSWINSGFVSQHDHRHRQHQSDATFISDGGAVMLDGGWQYGSAGTTPSAIMPDTPASSRIMTFPTLPAYGLTLFVVLVVIARIREQHRPGGSGTRRNQAVRWEDAVSSL